MAVGYHIRDNVRIEAAGAYRQLNGDTSSITIAGTTYTVDASDTKSNAFSVMGNVYLNNLTSGKILPYVGAGIGWEHEIEEGANAFAYQAMVVLIIKYQRMVLLFNRYYLNISSTAPNESFIFVSIGCHSLAAAL